jgi:type II secretory pathway pseudopilin PulG
MSARLHRRHRGAALITAMIMMTVMGMMIAMLMIYVSRQRDRGIAATKTLTRGNCAEAGLQYARGFFGRNAVNWNTYLTRPSTYDSTHPHPFNPVLNDAGNLYPADALTDAGQAYIINYTGGGVTGATSFVDLDGDNQPDVYIYVRDNDDEILPATPNWERDNDQNIIVGAMCVSKTMVPRRDGVLDRDPLIVESILSNNTNGTGYGGQSNCGTSGTGNCN